MLMQIVICATDALVIFVFVSVILQIVADRSILGISYSPMARKDCNRKLMGLTPRRDSRGRYAHAVLLRV